MKNLGRFSLSHIIPASGIVAIFDISEDEIETMPLICWGLVMNETGSRVTGMVFDKDKKNIIPVEERGKFLTYELMEWGFELDKEEDEDEDEDEDEESFN